MIIQKINKERRASISFQSYTKGQEQCKKKKLSLRQKTIHISIFDATLLVMIDLNIFGDTNNRDK